MNDKRKKFLTSFEMQSSVVQVAVQSIKNDCDRLWPMEEGSFSAITSSMIKNKTSVEGPAPTSLDVKGDPVCWGDSMAPRDTVCANNNKNNEEGLGTTICIEKQNPCWDKAGQVGVFSREQQVVNDKDKDVRFRPMPFIDFKCAENFDQSIVKSEFVNANMEPWNKGAVGLMNIDQLAGSGRKYSSCSLTFSSPVYPLPHQKFCYDAKERLAHTNKSAEGSSVERAGWARSEHVGPPLRGATGEHCSGERGKEPNVQDYLVPSSNEGSPVKERTANETCVGKGCSDIVTADTVKCAELTGSGDATMLRKPRSEKHLYECKECGLKFSEERYLIRHVKRHLGEKAHTCALCDTRCSNSSALSLHMTTHTDEMPYACFLCEARFAQNSALMLHLRAHTGEKAHLCTLCGARFLFRTHLREHMRTHTVEKPHACSLCEARFSRRSNLTSHMRTHTGEKPHVCTVCEAGFVEKRYLRKHMRTHTGEKPYACTLCDARYRYSSGLTEHMRKHTGEKPHACTLCDARFSEHYKFSSHMRRHTGEKPHVCTVCEARFPKLCNLTSHLRSHR